MEKSEIKEEILINRIFSSYNLNEKLGKEIINLISDDNGNYYIYVLANGGYSVDHYGKVKTVLLVRGIDTHCVQVLGKAEELKPILENQICNLANKMKIDDNYQVNNKDCFDFFEGNEKEKLKNIKGKIKEFFNAKSGEIEALGLSETDKRVVFRKNLWKLQNNYIKKEKINFNKKSLVEIYQKAGNKIDSKNLSVYITFKVGKYYKPKDKLYIVNDNKERVLNGNIIKLDTKKLSVQSLATFVNNTNKEFKKLFEITSGQDIVWDLQNEPFSFSFDDCKKRPILLDMLDQQNNESLYTNMIYYFLTIQKEVGKNIINELLEKYKINCNKENSNREFQFSENFTIEKEFYIDNENGKKGRIDLFINEKDTRIIIENKIDSNINGIVIKNNQIVDTQLYKYYKFMEDENKDRNFYFVFLPISNNIDKYLKFENMNEYYCVISYKELHKIFSRYKKFYKSELQNYFDDFLELLEIHSEYIDEYNYKLMKSKFINVLKNA